MVKNYSREDLIALCEQAIIHVADWPNTRTPSAMMEMGTAWALLKAGCPVHVRTAEETNLDPETVSCEHFLWIEIEYPSPKQFENQDMPGEYHDYHLVCLPTDKLIQDKKNFWGVDMFEHFAPPWTE